MSRPLSLHSQFFFLRHELVLQFLWNHYLFHLQYWRNDITNKKKIVIRKPNLDRNHISERLLEAWILQIMHGFLTLLEKNKWLWPASLEYVNIPLLLIPYYSLFEEGLIIRGYINISSMKWLHFYQRAENRYYLQTIRCAYTNVWFTLDWAVRLFSLAETRAQVFKRVEIGTKFLLFTPFPSLFSHFHFPLASKEILGNERLSPSLDLHYLIIDLFV